MADIDFASRLIGGGTQQQPASSEVDFASNLVGGNRATSGRQAGSGSFPRIDQPLNAISDSSRGADFMTSLVGGVPTDKDTAVRYFAKKRGLPLDRYAVVNGDIAYRGDDGKWYKEVTGYANNAAYYAPDVAEILPDAAVGVATAPMAISSPVGTLTAAGLTGATAAGSNYVRQKIAGVLTGQEYNPTETLLSGGLSLLAEGAPVVRKMVKERRLAKDIAHMDQALVDSLRSKAGQYGVPLTPAELTGLSSLAQQQKVLGNIEPSSVPMNKFYKERESKVRSAVNDYLDSLSQVDDVAEAGKMGQDALFAQRKSLESAREAAAEPYYKDAFEQSVPVDLSGVSSRINGFLKTAPDKGEFAKQLKYFQSLLTKEAPDVDPRTLQPLLDAEGNPLTKRVIEDRLPVLQKAKFEMDARLNSDAVSSLDKTLKGQLESVKNELVAAMEKENPAYAQANRKFEELSQPLNEFNSRVTGTSLTQIPQDNLKNFASRIFENPSPKTVKYAKDQVIAGGGQEAWDAVTKSYLQEVWSRAKKPNMSAQGEKLDVGNAWRNALFGDEKTDAALRVALSKEQYQALRDLAEVAQAAGRVKKLGSDTAFNQLTNEEMLKNPPMQNPVTGVARVAGTVLQPQNWGKMVSDWAVKRDASANADQLVQIITSPDGMARLRELRKMSPTSAKYWAGTAQLLLDYGILETRE